MNKFEKDILSTLKKLEKKKYTNKEVLNFKPIHDLGKEVMNFKPIHDLGKEKRRK